MYFTYVLYSPGYDRIYIGQTDNPEKRLERHNLGLVKSTKAYRPWKLIHYESFPSRRPWKLIHYESFPSRSEAVKREKELKSHQGRNFIRNQLLNARVRQ